MSYTRQHYIVTKPIQYHEPISPKVDANQLQHAINTIDNTLATLSAQQQAHDEHIVSLLSRLLDAERKLDFTNWVLVLHPEMYTEYTAAQAVAERMEGR